MHERARSSAGSLELGDAKRRTIGGSGWSLGRRVVCGVEWPSEGVGWVEQAAEKLSLELAAAREGT